MAHAIEFPALSRSRREGNASHGLDGSRIAANAGAISLNAVALLLLLAPVTLPPPAAQPERDPVITWVRPKLEPTPMPIPVPVLTRPEPRPQPTAASPRVIPANSADPVVDSIAADEDASVTDTVADAAAGDPLDIAPPTSASMRLQAIAAPSPRYPAEAIRGGLSGTVELEILVGVDGTPLDVRVVRSSGHRLLDQAARKIVLSQWRFQPAMRNGAPVQALGRVPIVFALER